MKNSFLPLPNGSLPIPAKYRILVEPSRRAGEYLGNSIADWWDGLVDRIYSQKQ